jgi:hypothetical protein
MNDENIARWWRKIGFRDSTDLIPGRGTKKLFRRDLCSFCGGPGGTLDHILPRSVAQGVARGNYMNYTGACRDCNGEKGSGHFLFFFAMKAGSPVIGHDHDPSGR